MRKANVYVKDQLAGFLVESTDKAIYTFEYLDSYEGLPVSLTMPTEKKIFTFSTFPPFFDGVLPEGIMLDGLLRQLKIDRKDYFSQLLAVGEDLVGAVTVKPSTNE